MGHCLGGTFEAVDLPQRRLDIALMERASASYSLKGLSTVQRPVAEGYSTKFVRYLK